MKIESFRERNSKYGAGKIPVLVHVQHVGNKLEVVFSFALCVIKNSRIGARNVVDS